MDGIPAPIDLGADFVGIGWDGTARALEGPGPPPRIAGITVGTWITDSSAPHGGERHDDGDEVLVLVSGAVTVVMETDAGAETVDVTPGHAVVVPRGVWHRVVVRQRSHIVFLTPGPGFATRPGLSSDATPPPAPLPGAVSHRGLIGWGGTTLSWPVAISPGGRRCAW